MSPSVEHKHSFENTIQKIVNETTNKTTTKNKRKILADHDREMKVKVKVNAKEDREEKRRTVPISFTSVPSVVPLLCFFLFKSNNLEIVTKTERNKQTNRPRRSTRNSVQVLQFGPRSVVDEYDG